VQLRKEHCKQKSPSEDYKARSRSIEAEANRRRKNTQILWNKQRQRRYARLQLKALVFQLRFLRGLDKQMEISFANNIYNV